MIGSDQNKQLDTQRYTNRIMIRTIKMSLSITVRCTIHTDSYKTLNNLIMMSMPLKALNARLRIDFQSRSCKKQKQTSNKASKVDYFDKLNFKAMRHDDTF